MNSATLVNHLSEKIPAVQAVAAVEAIIQYPFSNQSLLWEALQSAGTSPVLAGGPVHPDGNKRPAIVGDAVLRLVLVENWYHTKTVKAHADRTIQEMATNEKLFSVGKSLGLDRYVSVPNGMRGIPVPWRTLSATMEAILGVAYFDGGVAAVKRVMQTMGLVPTQHVVQ